MGAGPETRHRDALSSSARKGLPGDQARGGRTTNVWAVGGSGDGLPELHRRGVSPAAARTGGVRGQVAWRLGQLTNGAELCNYSVTLWRGTGNENCSIVHGCLLMNFRSTRVN